MEKRAPSPDLESKRIFPVGWIYVYFKNRRLRMEAKERGKKIMETVKRMDAHGTGGRAGY